MNDFPALENFFAAYFHQDWAQEHATADAVVDYYRDGESDETVARTRDELDRLLARDLDGLALAAQLRALGCEYDPTREGGNWQAWLLEVRQRLAG
ncbi:contact-dependent growth inhibition system immunity protein [Luteimonas sp. RD2P54]|uniref:Contact-dependent growth inhibition system immunity protein n=1 Tax=Luteimonas endophytica TaxID=3042023 RepID=A0ABT6JD48_9GAMM|nr:contact-dependent growth inhibition system immunity protein [Luteimonas endophytica]MDH5824748.1 contact-dependent growth inhibition system immunity protein [Luteimonas endophytica]